MPFYSTSVIGPVLKKSVLQDMDHWDNNLDMIFERKLIKIEPYVTFEVIKTGVRIAGGCYHIARIK